MNWEPGRWVALFRWKKGWVAFRHKHLADAQTYVLEGCTQGRDGVLEAADDDYEPNGAIHEAATVPDDTEHLFVCEGPRSCTSKMWGRCHPGATAMTARVGVSPSSDRELVLTRVIAAPREKLYRAWTEPDLLQRWFTPRPWTVSSARLDVRPGGSNLIVMRSPDGKEFPNYGVYLEVVPNERLVFTDAYTEAWVPSEKPFMTGILTFEDMGGKTRYTARVRHWSVADREAHERMGFHDGWAKATDQLVELVATL